MILVDAARKKGLYQVLCQFEAHGRSRQAREELFHAVATDQCDRCKRLLTLMADVNARDEHSGMTPLGQALRLKLEAMAILLIEQGGIGEDESQAETLRAA